jgi:4-alpha-glucanotransferase
MNVPGRPEGNWRWRCTEEMLSDPAFEWLRDLTKNANRARVWMAPESKVFETSSRT